MHDSQVEYSDWKMVGHAWAVEFLRRSLINGRSRHAYLVAGSAGLGKMQLARRFAMALNCEAAAITSRPCWRCRSCRGIAGGNDPDLVLVGADESGRIKIDTLRGVMRLLALKPYASRYRVAILDDFDQVMPQAQDALLKTLEEPAEHAVLILLAQESERILPTIRSRTQWVPLRPLPLEAVQAHLRERGCDEERAGLIARLSGGRIGWAIKAAQDDELLDAREGALSQLQAILGGGRLERMKLADQLSRQVARDKGQLRDILDTWQMYWRDVLLETLESPVKPCNSDRMEELRALALLLESDSALHALNATRRTARTLDTNANVRLALDALFLDYPVLA